MKILLVEDEAGIATVAKNVFESIFKTKEHQVLHAASLEECYQCLQRTQVDLILLDLNLSTECPAEVTTREIPTLKEYADVIVLSGYPEYAKLVVAQGALSFIEKEPEIFQKLELISRIITALKTKEAKAPQLLKNLETLERLSNEFFTTTN